MVAEPHKELRFTRSGQAAGFCVAGAVMIGIGVTLLVTGYYRAINPSIPHSVWAIPFLATATGLFILARHLTRHAYLILTPLGLEVFPFFRPSKGMQMVFWQEINAAEVVGMWLTLHFNSERTAGMHLSLRPVGKKSRSMLAKAVLGRVNR